MIKSVNELVSQLREDKDYIVYKHDKLDGQFPNREAKFCHIVEITDEALKKIGDFDSTDETELRRMLEVSEHRENVLFETIADSIETWTGVAAATNILKGALKYLEQPRVAHTSNIWVKDGDHNNISNMVWRMHYAIRESRNYHSQESVYRVSWSVELNIPAHFVKIAGQDNKLFKDKENAESYINGRIKKFSHLFTEISPVIPEKYKKYFMVNGLLLPGYKVEE